MHRPLALAVLSFVSLPLLAQESESPPAAPQQQEGAPERAPGQRGPQGPQGSRLSVPPDPVFQGSMFDGDTWRNLGPANPVGRLTDVAIHAGEQNTWYIGSAGGGVWKTENAGTTWTNLFDRQSTVSIGDIAIAPSDPTIVWVGTGEENARNSVQWGDGVYKSTDRGATWQHMGLFDTFQIGHIDIHPQNPDIVYVAALGRLWGENEERGVFKTTDGGKTWQHVLKLDDRTGCVDVRICPDEPDTVFACAYHRKRDMFDGNDPAERFGDKNGLYKSTDAGATWHRVAGGLPTCEWGRSGIDVWAGNANTMFAIIETVRSGWATGSQQRAAARPQNQAEGAENLGPPRSATLGVAPDGKDGDEAAPGAILATVAEGGAAATAGLLADDRITKVGDEAVKTFQDLLSIVSEMRGGEKIKVTFVRGEATKEIEVTLGTRQRGGGGGLQSNPDYPNGGRLFGQNEGVQNKQGDDGFETGGVFRSDDRGESWVRVNSLTERPFYYSVIRADAQDDQHLICVGTTLWQTDDGGKKFAGMNTGIHVDFHTVWIDPDCSDHVIAGCDGGLNETWDRGKSWQVHRNFCAAQFYDVVADNSVPYNVVGGLQDNGTWVGPSRTRNREGITDDDWVTIYGGDGFGAQTDPVEPWVVYATSQNGAMGIVDMRSGGQARMQRDRAPTGAEAKFNWDAPFLLSPHNRLTIYHAGNFVWRGERSNYLDNRARREDQGPIGANGVRMKCVSPALGATEDGTAVAIAESPLVQGLLYVGTDDGALWRSEDGAHTWSRIDQNLPIVALRYVSDIVPSHFANDRVYLTLDGHRFDDLSTYVFVSQDRGNTWKSLAEDLPSREPCYAVMEDPRNENLLFLGTEYGAHASLDRGQRWFPLGKGLPTVAVRDLFVQDRDSDLIAATHGRGVWVLDIEALRQCTQAIADGERHLFAVEPAILWRMTSRGMQGNKDYRAANPPYGATFHIYCKTEPAEAPVLVITDLKGDEVARVTGQKKAGMQSLVWDARMGQNRLAGPGQYGVRWQGQDKVSARAFTLLADPTSGADAAAAQPAQSR